MLEAILSLFRRAVFGVEKPARLFRVFGYYLSGAALDETSGYAKGPSAAKPVPDAEVARDFPTLLAVNPYFRPAEHDATFELGLDILIAEIERRRLNLTKRR